MRIVPTFNGPGGQGPARRILAIVAIAAIVIVGVGVAGWALSTILGGTSSPGEDDHEHDGGGVDTSSSVESARQALTTIYSWEPARDKSSLDALVRAKPMLTGEALAAATAPAGTARTDARWGEWASNGDIITAAVIDPTEQPSVAAVPGGVTLRATIAQTVQHTSGAMTPLEQFVVRVTMTRPTPAREWRLASFTVTEIR